MTSPEMTFWRVSSLPTHEMTDQQRGEPSPPLAWLPDPLLPCIDLPDPTAAALSPLDVQTALKRRRTERDYLDGPITLAELSYLLWASQGVVEVIEEVGVALRTVPSAGARHAFETFILANRVEGLTPGVYRYSALHHRLARYDASIDVAAKMEAAFLQQDHISRSAVTFIWAAVVERMAWRYGTRGLRYLLIEAGHIGQNMYFAGAQLGLGVCTVGGFEDNAVNALLGLDGEEQFAVYSATVGHVE